MIKRQFLQSLMIMTMHKVSTTWEVPERYLNLSPVGSGAFGQVSITGIMKRAPSSNCSESGMFSDGHRTEKRKWRRCAGGHQKDCKAISGEELIEIAQCVSKFDILNIMI